MNKSLPSRCASKFGVRIGAGCPSRGSHPAKPKHSKKVPAAPLMVRLTGLMILFGGVLVLLKDLSLAGAALYFAATSGVPWPLSLGG